MSTQTFRSVVVVDTETTGLDPFTDRVVEVGVVTLDPGAFSPGGTFGVVDEFSTLVNPGGPVAKSDIHGITDTDVAEAPTLADIWPAVVERLDGALVVGHNVLFDWSFLCSEALRAGLILPSVTLEDSKALAANVLPIPSHRLVHCCEYLGIDLSDAHSAAADAAATAQVWLKAREGNLPSVAGPLSFPSAEVKLVLRTAAPPPDAGPSLYQPG